MKLKLGIVYNENKIINHRSLLKILFNPILRFFALQIVTPLKINNELGFITITKCKRTKKIYFKKSWNYNTKYTKIIKKRRFI